MISQYIGENRGDVIGTCAGHNNIDLVHYFGSRSRIRYYNFNVSYSVWEARAIYNYLNYVSINRTIVTYMRLELARLYFNLTRLTNCPCLSPSL